MKSIILAAGIGSRLNLSEPKGLLRLPDNETLLARQVRIQKSFGLNSINIVVGHKNELIEKQITDVNYIHNPDYTDTNTAKSLLLGLQDIDDDIIWSNGDLIYDEEIIGEIIKSDNNTVIVNKARCGEEEVKYSINGSGQIVEISKEVRLFLRQSKDSSTSKASMPVRSDIPFSETVKYFTALASSRLIISSSSVSIP